MLPVGFGRWQELNIFQGETMDYVFKKYKEFYKKNGYIPEMFNPYNCTEITDLCPTLLTNCGVLTVSSTVLITENYEVTK
jgi:hypothetical protein